MNKINKAIQYNADYMIGKVTAIDTDEYTVLFSSTGGSVSKIKSSSGTYMVGDTVMVHRASRNMLTIVCLSPYA
jgi:hypothetical protein